MINELKFEDISPLAIAIEDGRFEDVDKLTLEREHYDDLKNELGYDTVWDMNFDLARLDKKVFKDKPYIVKYECIKNINDDLKIELVTFTAVTKDGTVGELWKAAESCYQQAKLFVGDWHIYIEDFEMQDDGSLSMITGS
jgi:hypothetical protein|tara:strand:- start:1292 stop:1711 length:420 start_codon:yes stop_codon:yes gene_type:complete